jgi:hypothetical protein
MPSGSAPRRLWRDLPAPERRQLRAYYRSIAGRYGPFRDRIVSEQARLVTEAWWVAVHASRTAITEATKRQHGRGRRPGQPAVNRAMRRSALQGGTYDAALRRLEELSGGERKPTVDELLARVWGKDGDDG